MDFFILKGYITIDLLLCFLFKISTFLAAKHGSTPYLYNQGCNETCPEYCDTLWQVWTQSSRRQIAQYVEQNLTLTKSKQVNDAGAS